jgi:hypothetical protein
MYKCLGCSTGMDPKGEISEAGNVIFHKYPKCKNVEIHAE